MTPYIPPEMARRSLFLCDAVLAPVMFSVPEIGKEWNIGVFPALVTESGKFCVKLSDYGPQKELLTPFYSRPFPDFDSARGAMERERIILGELGYNVK